LPEELTTVLVGRFVMNVSALNNYLDCPLGFFYKNILRIPTPKNEATAFGSAVHHALELFFRKMQESKQDVFPPLEQLLYDFRSFMEVNRSLFNREALGRRMRYGEAVLRNYYANYSGAFHRVVSVELNIRAEVNGVPIKGKIDKLEFDGKQVNVVDYKTGDIEKAQRRMYGPQESDPNGGDYWRQAVFYKLLVDNYSKKDWRVASAEFDFIEPDKTNQYRKIKIPIAPADVETVTQQLTMVWHKIQAHDFYTGCGSDKCTWCNFAKDNRLTLL
jgi:DNA helicase-2/ATP-dependent DNA helicase PcrA